MAEPDYSELEAMLLGSKDSSHLVGMPPLGGTYVHNYLRGWVRMKMLQLLNGEIEAEREACAQIVEAYVKNPRSFLKDAAEEAIERNNLLAKIRARSNSKSESTTA